MKLRLRKLFINLRKTKSANSTRPSSVSSVSTLSPPRTPLSTDDPSSDGYPFTESRGIFRTLEPTWYLHRSAMTTSTPAAELTWIPFTKHLQSVLETAYTQQETECLLPPTTGLPKGCTVALAPPSLQPMQQLQIPTLQKFQSYRPSTLRKRERPATVFLSHTLPHFLPPRSSSAPVLESPASTIAPPCPVLEINRDVQRTMAPVWWFEQDLPNGEKAMCRFDYRNQVRLEALAEGRSQMVLTDASFSQPFTVVLDSNLNRDHKEEWCGFLYLHPMPLHSYANGAAPLKDMYYQPVDNGMPMIARRYSM